MKGVGPEGTRMIRRNVMPYDRDQRVVKWTLLVAAFALSTGYFAESTLHRQTEQVPAAVEQRVEAKTPTVAEQQDEAEETRTSTTASVTG
jgi:hypothetical protein